MIFHIADNEEYNAARESGTQAYKPKPFDREGFIHCSTAAQIRGTLDKHFRSHDRVLILAIDAEREKGHIKYEDLYNSGQDFPHLYRPLPLSSVRGTFLLDRNKETGVFDVPDEWLEQYH